MVLVDLKRLFDMSCRSICEPNSSTAHIIGTRMTKLVPLLSSTKYNTIFPLLMVSSPRRARPLLRNVETADRSVQKNYFPPLRYLFAQVLAGRASSHNTRIPLEVTRPKLDSVSLKPPIVHSKACER